MMRTIKHLSPLWRDTFLRSYLLPSSSHNCHWFSTSSTNSGSISIMVKPQEQNNSNSNNTSNKKNKSLSKHRKQRSQSNYKFIDKVRVNTKAGDGGRGCISFESVSTVSYKKRPNGGHGGKGGNVIIVANKNTSSLLYSTHHFKAENGVNGTSSCCHGRNGKDLIISVPVGVIVKRVLEADEDWDDELGMVVKANHEDGENTYVHDDYNANDYKVDFDDDDDDETILEEVSPEEEEEEEEEDNDDSDDNEQGLEIETLYSNNINTKANPRKPILNIPYDFDQVVNTGARSEVDKMYYWDNPENDKDELDSLQDDDINEGKLERKNVTIADLNNHGNYVVVAMGGKGGIGNSAYAKRQHDKKNPINTKMVGDKACGKAGEDVYLELELKLIADIGLVGFPNAGKSSLLAAMSNAKPEIASYPFTTLHPLVGCIEYRDGFRILAADVPGLIDGAHYGRGRGHDFLRHLERTKALLYIVDAAGCDGRDPVDDLLTLMDEISSYGDGDMINRPAFVVANKLDLIPNQRDRDNILLSLGEAAEDGGLQFYENDVLGISAGVTGEGLNNLSKALRRAITKQQERDLKFRYA